MKLSPLQLVHSQFTAISVISNDVSVHVPESIETVYPPIEAKDLSIKIFLGIPDEGDDSHDFVVSVGVGNAEDTNSSLPYRFAAQIEGVFRIDHDGDPDERKRMVVVNGASMLFGSVREQILTITMRQKNGPMLLPSMDFRSLSEESQKNKPKRPRTSASKKMNPKRTTDTQ
ncbi:MAG: protein-export chaperone SecB [Pseudomonadota bacterium]